MRDAGVHLNKYESDLLILMLSMFIYTILQSSFVIEIIKSNLCRSTQERRNRLLHDRMRFNSKLRQKKDNKDKDPLEKAVLDALEDKTMSGSLALSQQE